LRRGLALNLPTCCSWTFREMQSRGFQTSPWRLALSLLVRFPDPLAFSSQAGTLSMSLPTESSKKCNQPVQAVLQSSTASPLSQKFSEMQLACRDMQVAGRASFCPSISTFAFPGLSPRTFPSCQLHYFLRPFSKECRLAFSANSLNQQCSRPCRISFCN